MSNGPQPPAPGQQVVIEIDWTDAPTPVYANGAQILNSQREFALVLTDFAAFAGRGNVPADRPPKAKIVSNVRMTPDVFFQIDAAAASNWNKFVDRYGDPGQPAPKFKLTGDAGVQLEAIDLED